MGSKHMDSPGREPRGLPRSPCPQVTPSASSTCGLPVVSEAEELHPFLQMLIHIRGQFLISFNYLSGTQRKRKYLC